MSPYWNELDHEEYERILAAEEVERLGCAYDRCLMTADRIVESLVSAVSITCRREPWTAISTTLTGLVLLVAFLACYV